jgi:two-component sensor histidine kinase
MVVPGEPRCLHLCWREQGGPLVTPPTRKGFGTRLIERSLALELSGEVNLGYEPEGVVCTIKAPLRSNES